MGGGVTGIELVNDQLYAVTDAGGLYRVTNLVGNSAGNNIGQYIKTATDLIGIEFSGLRAGPVSVEDGTLRELLFGVTPGGQIYAFNTRGELQNVFAGGRSVISTGIEGALGLDFSVVDFNLWHVTGQRGDDPGHGLDELFNDARPGRAGGSSLAFTYESAIFDGNYPSIAEQPVVRLPNGTIANPRLDGTQFEDSYNVPGGAKGVVQSNAFSLEGYAADDLPMLYFNYFMETDAVDGQDALRFYVVTSDGVEHLVATNNLELNPLDNDDEFDDPDPIQYPSYADSTDPTQRDDIDTDVQPLFNSSVSGNAAWRQARVPLGEFAGKSGLSLRIEFSTAGTTSTLSESIRVISGRALSETGDREFVISRATGSVDGQSFVLDLAPTVAFPSGKQLADRYRDTDEVGVISVHGQEYVLQVNGDPQIDPRDVAPGQIEIDLLADAPAGTTLAELNADEIAATVDRQIQIATPLATGFDFDDPDGQNDTLSEATPLPYAGGNLRIEGSGQIGIGAPRDADVDLVSLEVRQGALITVNLTLDDTINGSGGVVRFFDAAGNDLLTVTPQPGVQVATQASFTATFNGQIFIGLSGEGNSSYDPQGVSADLGVAGTYVASVSIDLPPLPSASTRDGNLVEFFDQRQSITASPFDLFRVTQRVDIADSISVPVSRFMSASQVAAEVQRAVANRFAYGNATLIPTSGALVSLPSFGIVDSGPFGNQSGRYGNTEGGFAAQENAFEGVYLDDFIIGFAERGEIATNSSPLAANSQFIADGSRLLTNPPQPTQPTTSGAYQLEIRDGSEYLNSSLVVFEEPELQSFGGDPIVVPVNGTAFGFLESSVPAASILPANQSPFPQFNLPTVDVVLDAAGSSGHRDPRTGPLRDARVRW